MMSRKGSAVIALLFVLIVLIALGAWYYFSNHYFVGVNPRKADPFIQAAIQQYSGSPQLNIAPKALALSPVDTAGYQLYSYDGINFAAPWKSRPVVKVSQPDGLLTFLYFSNNEKVIEIFASSSSISPLVGGALSAYLTGSTQGGPFTSSAWKSLYGTSLQSNYGFISLSLNSSPVQLSLVPADVVTSTLLATGLLPTKADIFQFLGQDLLPTQNISAIYDFSNTFVRGFEFVGDVTYGTTTQAVAHILLFDSHDRPFNLLTVGTTQMEDDFIMSTLKTD